MAEAFGEKQHEATPYRRQKAREQGEVARSPDLASAVLLIIGLLILLSFGGGLAALFLRYTEQHLGEEAWLSADRDFLVAECRASAAAFAKVLLPMLGLLVAAAIASHVGQTGFLFLPHKLAFDSSRISPLSGFRRIFSWSGAVRLAFGVFKILVVAAVAFACVWRERDQLLELSGLSSAAIASYAIQLTVWTCLKIGIALVLLAILDYGYQRWKHERDLRMTSQELREELKTLQGDPQITARRRAVQRQLVMQRIRSAVPKADVVITNPTELAIAIRYDMQTMDAPVVVAKGAGAVARHIRQLALEHGIPIVERKELARAIYHRVDVGRPIPPEQYAAMAEVLRYVYQLQGKTLPGMPRAA